MHDETSTPVPPSPTHPSPPRMRAEAPRAGAKAAQLIPTGCFSTPASSTSLSHQRSLASQNPCRIRARSIARGGCLLTITMLFRSCACFFLCALSCQKKSESCRLFQGEGEGKGAWVALGAARAGGARYCERVATVFARRQAPSGGAAPEASPATDCEALALLAPTTDDDAMAVSRHGVCASGWPCVLQASAVHQHRHSPGHWTFADMGRRTLQLPPRARSPRSAGAAFRSSMRSAASTDTLCLCSGCRCFSIASSSGPRVCNG